MANVNVGELIVVNVLPTQTELNNGSITVAGITKTFNFPVVFRVIDPLASASVDYTYIDAVTPPTASFNPDLSFIDGLDIVGTELRGVKAELIVPRGIVTIKENSFQNKFITKVVLPNSVITIGNSAFSGNKLTSVTIPDSVTSIGDVAFLGNQLASVTLPVGCTYRSSSFDVGVVITGGTLI